MPLAKSKAARKEFTRIRPIVVKGLLGDDPYDTHYAYQCARIWLFTYDHKHSFSNGSARKEYKIPSPPDKAGLINMFDRMLKITQGG